MAQKISVNGQEIQRSVIDPNVIFVHGNRGVFKFVERGKHWEVYDGGDGNWEPVGMFDKYPQTDDYGDLLYLRALKLVEERDKEQEDDMKEYSVSIFFSGHVTVRVSAANEEEAKNLAIRQAHFDVCHHCSSKVHFDDWDCNLEPDCVEIR
jgi:hypothetical protein